MMCWQRDRMSWWNFPVGEWTNCCSHRHDKLCPCMFLLVVRTLCVCVCAYLCRGDLEKNDHEPLLTFENARYDREEELASLIRDKRTADANYRKVKLALEGPPPKKQPSVAKKKDANEEEDTKKNGKGKQQQSQNDGASDKPFKPTATKKQLVSFATHTHTQ